MDRDDAAGKDTVNERVPSRRSGPRIAITERYSLAGEIGHGGMGEVIAAHDRQIGREVAIKRMLGDDASEISIARFLREARIQGRLEHPAIPPVHELGRDEDGLPYFAMKKLSGTTLGAILESSDPKFTRQRLLRAFTDVCLAVEFAHANGVIHRDLKPDNIMLGEFGEVYVLDWGVAKLQGDALDKDEGFIGSASSSGLATQIGTAIGTPGYMAPEQILGDDEIDERVDVYALGCVLFEILAGASLHPGGSAGMISAVEGKDGTPSLRSPDRDVAPELDALCIAATATLRDDRIATARALGDGVQHYLDGDRNLALRHELATGHQARAADAFARDDRATAMREAARSLALDPEQHAAAGLIMRLMLEPPRDLPPEVERALEHDGAEVFADHSRFAFWGYAVYAAYLPLVFALAPIGTALAFVAAQAVVMTCAGIAGFTHRRISVHAFVIANAVLIGILSMIFTPLLYAPTVAAITGLVFALNPLLRPWPRVTVVALMVASFGVPWLLELAGILPHTFRIDASGVHLFGDGLRGGAALTAAIVSMSAVVSTIVAVIVGHSIRLKETAARRRLHLQAWQLRQLVPEVV